MSTPREQYDAMLEDLDAETKLSLIQRVSFAKLLEEADPAAYRCGCADFQPTCDECSREFWADDPDEDSVCANCKEQAEEDAKEAEEETK